MAGTFARLRRRQEKLNEIARTPERNRSWWDRLTFQLFASHFISVTAKRYACFIPVHVTISPSTKFGHAFNGVHISGNAKIGERCEIMQNVTIGSNIGDGRTEEAPAIGNDVFIGANAVIIGRCVIGDGAKIGAGVTLVNATVPPGALIVNSSAYDLANGRFVYDKSRRREADPALT